MALPKIFAEIGLDIAGFERNAGEVSKRLNAIDRDAQRSLSGFEKMGDRLTEVGRSMTIGLTAPLAAIAGVATKFATDFELEMRKVTSLLGKDAPKEFGNLSAAVLDVSKRMGVDAVKAAQALYEAISAGVPKENATTFLEIASKAAIAGVTETKVAVDALTSAMNAYGPSNLSAKAAADQMFQAVNLGKFTFEQLSASLSIATPLAAQLGIAFTDILAPAATLTSQGFSISEAMTALRSAIVGILSPNKQMNELFAKLNVTSGEALIKQRGLQGAFEDLQKAAGGSTQAIQEALGRVEGLGAVLGTTGQNAQKARADLDSIRQASDGLGASTAAYNEINKSAARQFEQLAARLKTTGIELGTVLLPSVLKLLEAGQPLLQFLANLVTRFTQLPSSVQTFTIALAAGVAVIGPLVAGIGLFVSSATGMIAAMSAIGTAVAGIVLPQLVAFGAAIGNVGFAVANGMTGALTGGEAALLSFGKMLGTVALVAATAFAAFKFGELLYDNIPAVKAFGDAIADLLTYIPGVTTLIEKLSGASAAAARATGDLDFATQKLEASLKAKGIVVEKTGKSTEEYGAALRQAAKDSGLLSKNSNAAEIEKYKKQIQDSARQAALYAEAQKQLGIKTKDVADAHEKASKPIREVTAQTEVLVAKLGILRSEHSKNVQELAALQVAMERGKVGTVEWSTELDKLVTAMGALGDKSNDIAKAKLPAWAAAIPQITQPNKDLIDALQKLGITSATEYKKVADEAAKARDAVMGSSASTDFEKKSAIYVALKAQVEYSKVAGEVITKDQRELLDRLASEIDAKVPKMAASWDTFSKGVSTVITNLSQDIVHKMWRGGDSFAEKGIDALKSLGEAVTSSFVEPATAALTKFLHGVIKDLLSGKGFGGILSSISDIGKSVSGIFGGGSGGGLVGGASIPGSIFDSAGGIIGAGGSAAGSAGGAAGGAASGAAGAASGILGALGAVGAIGSFATGVISNFQQHGMNVSLGRIEESSRFTAIGIIGPGGIIDTERTFLPWLEIIGRYFYTVQQPWMAAVSSLLEGPIQDRILQVDAAIRGAVVPLLEGIHSGIAALMGGIQTGLASPAQTVETDIGTVEASIGQLTRTQERAGVFYDAQQRFNQVLADSITQGTAASDAAIKALSEESRRLADAGADSGILDAIDRALIEIVTQGPTDTFLRAFGDLQRGIERTITELDPAGNVIELQRLGGTLKDLEDRRVAIQKNTITYLADRVDFWGERIVDSLSKAALATAATVASTVADTVATATQAAETVAGAVTQATDFTAQRQGILDAVAKARNLFTGDYMPSMELAQLWTDLQATAAAQWNATIAAESGMGGGGVTVNINGTVNAHDYSDIDRLTNRITDSIQRTIGYR